MVIKASASAEIRALVEALVGAGTGASDDVHREAAIARLAIIGDRAVDRLLDVYGKTTDRHAQVAILRTLDAIGDHRGEPIARQAIARGGDVAIAATGVLRTLLISPKGTVAAAALDTLVAVALDRTHDQRLRLGALEALQDMPEDVRTRVADAMQQDPDSGLRDVARIAGSDVAPAEAIWRDAVDGRLPDEPQALREALTTRAGTAPLTTLQKMIDAVRTRESALDPAARQGWLAVRGALHQALALRGSRVALYDLRESLDEGGHRLPVSFLAALHVLGDVSCLEPLAAAWSRTDPADERWRHQLAATFQAIMRREKITKRHAAMKRIAARWPEAPLV